MAEKTLYFYQMEIFEKLINGHNEDDYKKKYIPRSNINKQYKKILNNKNLRHNSLILSPDPINEVIEVLNNDNDFLFARMGKEKEYDTVHLRDKTDLKPSEIKQNANQMIEIYTYFLLDYRTGIVTFVNTTSAPPINTLNMLIARYADNVLCKTELNPIISKDVIDILIKKQIINSIDVDVEIPSDQEIGLTGIGFPENYFEKIASKDLRTQRVQFKILASPNSNMFKSNSEVVNFINESFNGIKGKIKRFRFKAKDFGERRLVPYDIIEKQITYKAKIEYVSNEEIEKKLKGIYLLRKTELLKYTRPDIKE